MSVGQGILRPHVEGIERRKNKEMESGKDA